MGGGIINFEREREKEGGENTETYEENDKD